MSVNEILPAITGAGGALVALAIATWALATGRVVARSMHDQIVADKNQRIAELLAANAAERQRADISTTAAQTTNQILTALHAEVTR